MTQETLKEVNAEIFVKSIESPYYNVKKLNLNPKIGLNGNIYLLSNDHILRLNDGNEERSIVWQPAYEEVTYREIEGEKSLSERKQRDKTNRKIKNKLERRKKKKQNLQHSVQLQSLKPIVLSGIRDVNLIETSDCVFKIIYLDQIDRIRDEKRLNLKASRALSECEERHFRKDRRREKARTLLDRYMKYSA
ncbi:unnamed protein product [Rhizophagus irregularis]|nr:unnamed protein product [Rhizophagus irregularis]